ncbi:MAG: CinA family protein [Deltaproteobacteria bacterium]|nr:CinA family protein [Deltaproteobacteria bacterium]
MNDSNPLLYSPAKLTESGGDDTALFLPISGNPLGFNHLAAAEWMLRSGPGLNRVVLVLSNGRHPDPTKPDAAVSKEDRLAVVLAALEALADPERSWMARRAAAGTGETLRAVPGRVLVSTAEFALEGAVRTAQLVQRLLGGSPGPLNLFAGADLVARMADPAIFSDPDVNTLARQCRYWIMERDHLRAEEALALVARRRGVSIQAQAFPLKAVPDWLAPFFHLSSTHIRHACQAGDPLGGMLPDPAARLIQTRGLYRKGRLAARLVDRGETLLAEKDRLTLRVEEAEARLAETAREVARRLQEKEQDGPPPTLSLAESSTGGRMAAALLAVPGVSRFFLEGRVAYSPRAKMALVEALPQGAQPPHPEAAPAVSQDMAEWMARGLRAASGADWALAETGMAGPPDGERKSMKNGLCYLAVTGPGGTLHRQVELPAFLTRREHQLAFALEGLRFLRETLA